MKFDESKVYTALNADEIKVGSKGYFADSIGLLKECVTREKKAYYGKIESIYHEAIAARFSIENDGSYIFFYLIEEEPQEKKLRPYRDTDEMIEDFERRLNITPQKHCPPTIWIKKTVTGVKYLVVRIGFDEITIVYDCSAHTLDVSELVDIYTYLDGSPCGIEEEDYE